MLSLGYEKTGVSFPVFRHPETKEEYALARTETKKFGIANFEVKTEKNHFRRRSNKKRSNH